jgi:hypothetical protein
MPFDNTHCPNIAKMIDNSNAMEEKVSTRNKKYLFMQPVRCDQETIIIFISFTAIRYCIIFYRGPCGGRYVWK